MPDGTRESLPIHRGLYEVHIPVRGLARSILFYEKLGFSHAFGRVEDGSVLLVHEGDGARWMLGLFAVDDITHRHTAESHFSLRVPEDRVDDMIPWLLQRGIEPRHPDGAPLEGVMSEPIVHGWMPAAAVFFRDPDGHLLELIADLAAPPRAEAVYQPLSEWRRA